MAAPFSANRKLSIAPFSGRPSVTVDAFGQALLRPTASKCQGASGRLNLLGGKRQQLREAAHASLDAARPPLVLRTSGGIRGRW